MDHVGHFEIPTDKPERAKKFYQEVFGWEINEMPEMNYTHVKTVETKKNGIPKELGAINGGLIERDGKIKCPVITVIVEDIDKTAAMIREQGGKMVEEKSAAGEMGWYAYFKDSEGNVLGLWQMARK